MDASVKKYLSSIGSIGGAAGRGAVKARHPEVARRAALIGWEKRRAKISKAKRLQRKSRAKEPAC